MNRLPLLADTDLRVFRDPASVAVVGATADPAKWGCWLAKGAGSRHRREVYLVNRSGVEILGRASHRALGELPATPELVALCVPPAHIGAVVDEALALGDAHPPHRWGARRGRDRPSHHRRSPSAGRHEQPGNL